jgi:predicted RNase H-like HicB family nuclease
VNNDLTIIYEWSEDGWWVAEVAEVPGAISQGRTKEEAKAGALDALDELLIARRDLAVQAVKEPSNVETIRRAS